MKEFDCSCNPKTAWLTLNRQCNFRCRLGYGEDTHYDPKETMSLAMAKELVMVAHEMGVDHFNVIGGEPTLWPDLLEFNRFCKDLGVTNCIVTNAALFGDDSFWAEYQQSPCDNVSISVKAVGLEQFKDATKVGIYDQTMKGIERAINFYQTGVSTVYNSLVGMDGLKQIATLCHELGAKSFLVDLCCPVITDEGVSLGYSIEPHQLANDIMEMHPFLDELYNGKIEIETYIPLCLFPESFIEKMLGSRQIATICHVYGRSGLNFDTNGDVMACNQLLGSIIAQKGIDYNDGTSLSEHLNSDELKEDYKQLLRYPSEECDKCRWNVYCRGGCLINWMIFDPSMCHAIK